MKGRLVVAGALALALSACGNGPQRMAASPSPAPGTATPAASSPGAAGGAAPPSPGSSSGGYAFTDSYEQPEDKALLPAEKLLKDNRMLEDWAQTANDSFIPPVNVPIVAKQCDTINAFYNPDDKSLTICYEMVDYLQKLFRKPESGETASPSADAVDQNVVGAMNGIFYHELGHGLIDLYDLPSTGKEEDAVDQLSALVLIGSAEDSKDYSDIISTIETWGRMSQQEGSQLDQGAFADEHSLSAQRYYNMMCYLYGSNHNAFLPLVADGELPVARAQKCEDEYKKMAHAWATLLEPHLRTDLPTAPVSETPTPSPTPAPSET